MPTEKHWGCPSVEPGNHHQPPSIGYARVIGGRPGGTSTSPTNSSTVASGPAAVRQSAQRLHVHQTVYLPNLPPAPVNGMIKTYGTEHRTFTRPHSAKTVFFYKDNDTYYTGLRVPISKARYRTINSLLDTLNERIELPYGARHLYTPYGRTPIKTLDQLEHLGR
ncbi:Doublecortin domain-containing protein [Aphelenchoides fujianensis]|nr:Doublecortin domain-containing protein [Aphelenchoides fujianensis]